MDSRDATVFDGDVLRFGSGDSRLVLHRYALSTELPWLCVEISYTSAMLPSIVMEYEHR